MHLMMHSFMHSACTVQRSTDNISNHILMSWVCFSCYNKILEWRLFKSADFTD